MHDVTFVRTVLVFLLSHIRSILEASVFSIYDACISIVDWKVSFSVILSTIMPC